ncbi:calcium-binding and coiled-coil domain-containing protein 1 isoform X1 [Ascaphus truei]|uniref:calcium-binding and coiled-coil domain-containing protein 1 isoform X1 n=1 Tax=Ascaphus truei TaxID=8439 RepID=UPI003F593A20
MEETSQSQHVLGVTFLNVARTYIPNTKVECHYTLPVGMKGSTSDWIGIYKMEASSIRDYDTFVWAVSSESSGEGLASHCSVQFQAYYLPRPGDQRYHYRYVDRHGSVRGHSEAFVFNEPRPMEDLVTLEDEEASMDMLLVIPKATFLQNQLELCQQERNALMRVRLGLEEEVGALQKRIRHLEATLETSDQRHATLSQQHQDLTVREQMVKEERELLSHKEAAHRVKILQLECDIQSMNQKMLERDNELDILGTRNSSIEAEKEEIKQRLAEAMSEKERCQLQVDTLCERLRCNQDVLYASQQKAMLLGEEIATVSTIRDRIISDLHKSRLETTDLAIKVSDLSLKHKEEMGQWWQEKTALAHRIEAKRDQIVNLKAEKLCLESSLQDERSQRQALQCKLNQEKDASQVQLSESRRELSELKSALKVAQMEKVQLREERQEMLQYVRRLEERLDKLADEKWKEIEEETTVGISPPSSPVGLSDSDDEVPKNKRIPQQLGPYTLSEQQHSPALLVFPQEPQKVVINQPAPIACQLTALPEDSSSDSEAEDDNAALMAAEQSAEDETSFLLPEQIRPSNRISSNTFSTQVTYKGERQAGGGPWKECPVCKEPFPPECQKETLEEHMDHHFYYSTHDPSTLE